MAQGNLLRNGDFQDDWITYIPELKNHHWNYTTEVFNRRDYNPDAWKITGSWEWRDADKPRGQRKLILNSPSKATQTVNWIAIHNPKSLRVGLMQVVTQVLLQSIVQNLCRLFETSLFLQKLLGKRFPRMLCPYQFLGPMSLPMNLPLPRVLLQL